MQPMVCLARGTVMAAVLLLAAAAVLAAPPEAHANQISVTGSSLGNTTVIEVTNGMDVSMGGFSVWPNAGTIFLSFKTVPGWSGEQNQSNIEFVPDGPLEPGETAKFGIKSSIEAQSVNWKAVDVDGAQLQIGVATPEQIPQAVVAPPPVIEAEMPPEPETPPAMTSESTFRIVPSNPNTGSTIRVTGEKFGPNENFDFFINTDRLGGFTTDKDGNFMTTMEIPDSQEADRVEFKVVGEGGEERMVSLRLGSGESRTTGGGIIELSVSGIPEVAHRGQTLEISGMGEPEGAITSEVTNPAGVITNTRIAEINTVGDWKLEPLVIPLDAPFGKYAIKITDGRNEITKELTLESDKVIEVAPAKDRYDRGDTIEFSGKARPNQKIEFIVEDPLNKEVFSHNVDTDGAGAVKFEYKTTQNSPTGTYTVIATQGTDKEFIFVGLEQAPDIPVRMEFDKLHYKPGDTAEISFAGQAGEIVSLIILDPSDNPVVLGKVLVDNGEGDKKDVSITIQPDGRATYRLDLTGYGNGVYSAVVKKGTSQSTETFTVGLTPTSGDITINTTKTSYEPGDAILILGDTENPNSTITISLSDPEGTQVKTESSYSDKNGKITVSTFRIPPEPKAGMWTVEAKSDSSSAKVEIEVIVGITEGIVVSVSDVENMVGRGDFITIQVLGATPTATVQLAIGQGDVTIDELAIPATRNGEVMTPWYLPDEFAPGTYTVDVTSGKDEASTTFTIK